MLLRHLNNPLLPIHALRSGRHSRRAIKSSQLKGWSTVENEETAQTLLSVLQSCSQSRLYQTKPVAGESASVVLAVHPSTADRGARTQVTVSYFAGLCCVWHREKSMRVERTDHTLLNVLQSRSQSRLYQTKTVAAESASVIPAVHPSTADKAARTQAMASPVASPSRPSACSQSPARLVTARAGTSGSDVACVAPQVRPTNASVIPVLHLIVADKTARTQAMASLVTSPSRSNACSQSPARPAIAKGKGSASCVAPHV